MYLLRGAVVSLVVFFLVYAGLSGILVCVWQLLRRKSSIQGAATLYGIRVLPLIGACALVSFFAVPSFLYLEPFRTDERIGLAAFAIAVAGLTVLLAGFLTSAKAYARTSRFVRACLAHSRRLQRAAGVCSYELLDDTPLLFVGGVWRPKLLISSGTLALLDADEMQAAIQHELAHVSRRDNLRKLVLHFCRLPWLASLEREWLKATEVAADDAAANNEGTALHLASALIKMARASSRIKTPELGMTLVPQNGTSVSLRVGRLLSGNRSATTDNRLLAWVLLASAALGVSLSYAWALTLVHDLTELLFR